MSGLVDETSMERMLPHVSTIDLVTTIAGSQRWTASKHPSVRLQTHKSVIKSKQSPFRGA